MTHDEAREVLANVRGRFSAYTTEHGTVRLKYTGVDPEEEGRVAQAVILLADEAGIDIGDIQADNVHVASDSSSGDSASTDRAGKEEGR